MTATAVIDKSFQSAFAEPPGAFTVPVNVPPAQQKFYARASQYDALKAQQQQQQQQYVFPPMDVVQPSLRQPSDPEKAAFEADMGPVHAGNGHSVPYQQQIDVDEIFLPSPYDPTTRPLPARNDSSQTATTLSPASAANLQTQTRSPPISQQPSEDPGVFALDTRPANAAEFAEVTPNKMPVQYARAVDEVAFREARPTSIPTPMSSRRPSSGMPNGASFQEPQFSSVLTPNSAPMYKPTAVPISANNRAIAQQPTYITPPSSPTPIAVNTIYNYAGGPYGPDAIPQGAYNEKPYKLPMGFAPPDGKEICVECAMRDEDMADVDATGPGVWDRESDVYYHELCRQEAEEQEERMRARASNSSSESHAVLKAIDPTRPRAKGHRLTEQNVKLWLSMVCAHIIL